MANGQGIEAARDVVLASVAFTASLLSSVETLTDLITLFIQLCVAVLMPLRIYMAVRKIKANKVGNDEG